MPKQGPLLFPEGTGRGREEEPTLWPTLRQVRQFALKPRPESGDSRVGREMGWAESLLQWWGLWEAPLLSMLKEGEAKV